MFPYGFINGHEESNDRVIIGPFIQKMKEGSKYKGKEYAVDQINF